MEMIPDNPFNLNVAQSVGDWVTADYRFAAVFDKHGIDFCCGGQKPVQEACAGQGISPETILREVTQVAAAPGSGERYDQWAPDFLADYIVNQFHNYTKEALPKIGDYLTAVVEAHGVAHPETKTIADLWASVQAELSLHMQKEELMLFPYIKRLARVQSEENAPSAPPFGSAAALIAEMEAEHEATGDGLAQMAALSSGYTPPADACPTYRTLYALLQEFDTVTKKHVHLENNILFPKAIKLEEKAVHAG